MTTNNRRLGRTVRENAKLFACVLFFILSISLVLTLITMELISMIRRKPDEPLNDSVTSLAINGQCGAVCEVRQFLDKNAHVRASNLSDAYIEMFLNSRENNSRLASQLMVNYFRFRSDHRELFMSATAARNLLATPIFYHQTQVSPSGGPITYVKQSNWDFNKVDYAVAMATAIPFEELVTLEGRNRLGTTTIMDMSGWSWSHFMAVKVKSMQLATELIDMLPINQDGRVHVVHQDWLFDMLFALGKSFMSEKQIKSMTFHGDDLSGLYAEIPREVLPKAVGGHCDLRVYSKRELEDIDAKLKVYWAQSE